VRTFPRPSSCHRHPGEPTPRTNDVISLDRYISRDDAALNAEWDRLVQLVDEAWTWRDPVTLAALGSWVVRLGLRSLGEWKD